VVYIEFEAVVHQKAVYYSTVTKYLHVASLGGKDAVQADSEDTVHTNLVDQAILQALGFQPFASVCQIFRTIFLLKSTVYKHLSESLGFISQRLR
jgi:hypothetical protein